MRRRWSTRLIVLAYLAIGGALVWFGRDHINPDGISYVQLARHYAGGNWDLAVSSYWSPLLPWLLVPFTGNGFEPVLASKMLGLAAGLLFAAGTVTLTREILLADPGTRPRSSLVASATGPTLAVALLAVLPMLPWPVTPDLLLAAILTWYFAMSLRWLREASLPAALAGGVLGGIAYLAKAYALPFVLLHTVVTALMAAPRLGGARALRLAAASAVLTAAVAAPWVTVLSIRDGRPTFTAVTRFMPPWNADPSAEVGSRELFGLAAPAPGQLTIWERPEAVTVAMPDRPAALTTGLSHFASRLDTNLTEALATLKGADPAGLLAAGLVVAFILLAAVRPGESAPARWPIGWSLATIALYAGGYVMVYVEGRYLWPLFGLAIALTVVVLGRLHRAAVGWPGARLNAMMRLLLVGSFCYGGGQQLATWAAPDGPGAQATALRALAGAVGPGAALASNRWPQGLYVAYWSKTRFVGTPVAGGSQAVARQLASFAPVRLLLFDDRTLAHELALQPAVDLPRAVDGVWGTADLVDLPRQADREPVR